MGLYPFKNNWIVLSNRYYCPDLVEALSTTNRKASAELNYSNETNNGVILTSQLLYVRQATLMIKSSSAFIEIIHLVTVLRKYLEWDDALPEDLVRAAYDRLAGTRYTALMHKLKKNRVRQFMLPDEAWRRYFQYWESEDFQARSRQATENRNTEVEGPGTGPSKHGGGSVSFATTQERLDRLQSRRQELTQATPEQSVDDEAVYLNVAGESSKGRVYGLGSVGRKKRRYGAPGASTSRRRMWCRGRVRCRCGATTKGYELHASASWDGHGRNRPSSRTTTTTATTTATS
ncbi:hypothetical protein Syun_027722 [Stephania yunnanensis]|uniref:Uncharacterized protein n=1 Tax=Stephania yunnanensis TaxID=152371 RepID=A0AAP0EG30_9MAGN